MEDQCNDSSQTLLAETLARIDSRLTELKKSMDHTAIIEVKTEVTKTDVSVEKVCSSVQSLIEEIKTLMISQKKPEIEQMKTSDRISSQENKQLDQEKVNDDLKKKM